MENCFAFVQHKGKFNISMDISGLYCMHGSRKLVLCHFLSQSQEKIPLCSDWFIALFLGPVVIDQSDYVGLCFTTFN